MYILLTFIKNINYKRNLKTFREFEEFYRNMKSYKDNFIWEIENKILQYIFKYFKGLIYPFNNFVYFLKVWLK